MSWDAELIHSVMTPGADKWWSDEHPHERGKWWEEPVWPLSTVNLNARTLSVTRHAEWQHTGNISSLRQSSVILISHSLACSDVRTPRSLGAHIPRCRVTSASESESLVPPRHYLESYHYQQPGSARTKLLTQTFAHPVSISTRTLTW